MVITQHSHTSYQTGPGQPQAHPDHCAEVGGGAFALLGRGDNHGQHTWLTTRKTSTMSVPEAAAVAYARRALPLAASRPTPPKKGGGVRK